MNAPTSRPTTPYERIGGRAAVAQLVNRFYDIMDEDAAFAPLRAIHAPDLGPMRESLTGFLVGWMGGPRDWFAGGKCVMSAHAQLMIDGAMRDQWLAAMRRAAEAHPMDVKLREAMLEAFTRMANGMARA